MTCSNYEGHRKSEMEWNDRALGHIPSWNECRYSRREFIHVSKRFVFWRFVDGAPVVLNMFQVDDIAIDWNKGFRIRFVATVGEDFYVTSMPSEHQVSVFLWVPAFSEVRYMPANANNAASARRLTLPLLIKIRTSECAEGEHYFTSLIEFKTTWPGSL